MTIETILTARSLWYVDMRQLNPRGRNIFPLIAPLLQEWYGFTPPREHSLEKGVTFAGGEFSHSGQRADAIGIEVTFYHDGLVASSRTSTGDTDLFLDDALGKLAQESIVDYRPRTIKRKLYSSEIVSSFERRLAIPALERVCQLLSQTVYGGNHGFEAAGLIFDIDQAASGRQIPFRFERRANAPFSENTYYSHGPLKTPDHIAVLRTLEEALAVP